MFGAIYYTQTVPYDFWYRQTGLILYLLFSFFLKMSENRSKLTTKTPKERH